MYLHMFRPSDRRLYEFEYMTTNFKFDSKAKCMEPLDDVDSLTETDIVRENFLAVGTLSFVTSRHYFAQLADREEQFVNCDLVRLKHHTGFQNNWGDPSRPSEGNYQPDEYDECKSGSTLVLIKSSVGRRQVMQLGIMDKVRKFQNIIEICLGLQ
jgi:hypothetical protein